MELKEVNDQELQLIRQTNIKTLLIFVYTPLCGTCKLGRRMLEIAAEPFKGKIMIVACNLNIMPRLAEEWKLQSVPSLVFLNKNKVYNIIFSFQSVTNLVTNIKDFIQNSGHK